MGTMLHRACFALLALLPLSLAGCQPKVKLPPRTVPQVGQLTENSGQRDTIIADAVQAGSNLARLAYDCATPYGLNVEGAGVLAPTLSRCEYNQETQELAIAGDEQSDCPAFRLTLTRYHGPGTYNTSSLGSLSFGTAKVSQRACNFEANLCMNWNGATGPHPDTTCTIEVTSDGGLQYGTLAATVSGTMVCTAFRSDWKGCPGVKAQTGCAITRGSFSVAGCAVQAAPKTPPPKKGRKG